VKHPGGSKSNSSRNATSAQYDEKPSPYFEGVNARIASLIPTDHRARILEIGCGAGLTGAAIIAAGKAADYVGIELNDAAAAKAADRLSRVIVGDVETLDLGSVGKEFDGLIASEVLEHLIDPWRTLRRLVKSVKLGGFVICSSPNIANRQTISALFCGRFDYTDRGVMDRTHLRWFTPKSLAQLVIDAGVEVSIVEPLVPLRPRARIVDAVTRRHFQHLFHNQTVVFGQRVR